MSDEDCFKYGNEDCFKYQLKAGCSCAHDKTMIGALGWLDLFGIQKTDRGNFSVRFGESDFNQPILTKQQLIDYANELLELAES